MRAPGVRPAGWRARSAGPGARARPQPAGDHAHPGLARHAHSRSNASRRDCLPGQTILTKRPARARPEALMDIQACLAAMEAAVADPDAELTTVLGGHREAGP